MTGKSQRPKPKQRTAPVDQRRADKKATRIARLNQKAAQRRLNEVFGATLDGYEHEGKPQADRCRTSGPSRRRTPEKLGRRIAQRRARGERKRRQKRQRRLRARKG